MVDLGVEFGCPVVNIGKLRTHKDKVIVKLTPVLKNKHPDSPTDSTPPRTTYLEIYFMDSTSSTEWYAQLIKPFFAPPAFLFGPVWSVLYVIIAISFGYVLVKYLKRRLPFGLLLPFILNLVFNAAYTPIQFGLKNNLLASVDILLVLGTLVWALAAIWRRTRWVAYVNIPYLLWVGFATVLQLSITWLNR
jgi:benzodiazapine receptor